MCYLGKCVYVDRNGSLENKRNTLLQLNYLLDQRDSLCIFPEGGRSRSGRVQIDSAVYGVGHLISKHPEAQIWCVYLRGDHQESYSFFPKRGENFYMAVEAIRPHTSAEGRRGERDLALQVMNQLAKMEHRYFDDRQRYRLSKGA